MLHHHRSKISIIYLSCFCSLLFCISCGSDSAPIPEDKVESTPVTKKPAKKEEAPSISEIAGNIANQKIDYRDMNQDVMEYVLHEEVNKMRSARKLPRFKRHQVLVNAAIDQNNYIVRLGDLSHSQNNAGKKTLGDRVKAFGGGFQAMAENLIYEGFAIRTTNGTQTEVITISYQEMAQNMVKNWLASPGHRRNLLNPKYDQVGTAIGYNGKLHAVFATQVFGKTF